MKMAIMVIDLYILIKIHGQIILVTFRKLDGYLKLPPSPPKKGV